MRQTRGSNRLGATLFSVMLLIANQFGISVALATGGPGGHVSPFDANADGLIDGSDLAPVLANWNSNFTAGDFNGDCTVDSGDLGMLLAAWGPVVPPSGGRVVWKNKSVSLCFGPGLGSIDAVVSGQYSPVAGPGGDPCGGGYGDFSVTLDGVVTQDINISPQGIIAFGFDCKITLDPSLNADEISVDGIPTPIDTVLQGVAEDFQYAGDDVLSWNCYTQMMMSMLVVFGDAEMKANQPEPCNDPGFWCKAFATAAGMVVVGLGTAGCTALTAGCSAATPITLGGITLPCVAWIGICAGLVAGGYQAAYEVALSWCD